MAQEEVKYLIELLAKNKGALEAAAALSGVGKSAEGTTGKLGLMNSMSAKLGATLAGTLGVGALLAYGKASLTAFAQTERAFNSLRIQMNNLGIDSSRQLPRVQEFLERLEAAGDGMLKDTVPAFQTFLGLTKDVDAALFSVNLASRISESGLKDFGGAADVLASVLSGKANRALKDLGINLQESEDGSVDAKLALEKLTEAFPQAVAQIEDTTDKLDKLASVWEGLKRFTGETLVFAAEGIGQTFKAVQEGLRGTRAGALLDTVFPPGAAEQTGERVGEEFDEGMKKALEVADQARKAAQAKKDKEAAEKAKDAAARRTEFELRAEAELQESKADMTAAGTKARLQAELRLLDRQKAIAIASAGEVGASTAAIDQAFALAAEQLNAEHNAILIEQDAELFRLRMEGAVRQREMEEAEAARQFEIRMQQEMAEEELVRTMLEGNRITLQEREALEKQLAANDLKRKLAMTKSLKEQLALIKAHNERVEQIEAQSTAIRIDIAQTWANAAFTVGNALFGENKALAIAEALVNTYLGVARAMGTVPYPANIAAAALVLAQGLAAVQQIRKTEKEKKGTKGFDNALNDRLAYLGGQRWADDMIRLTNEGFRDAVANRELFRPPTPGPPEGQVGGMGGGDVHFHIGNVYGGPSGLRALGREIERARRLDRRVMR